MEDSNTVLNGCKMIILHTVNLQNQNKMQAGFKDTPNIAEKMSKK